MKKITLKLSKGSDARKKKKKTSQLKELLKIFHVFEHRKDKTIKAYPNLERSATIPSV